MKSVLWGAAAAIAIAASPVRAELKIGVVDFARLLQESPQAQTIQRAMRSEFEPRQQELNKQKQAFNARADAFQKNAATMTDEQRDREQKDLRDKQRDLQAKESELQDDFSARRNEELSRLQKSLIEQVQSYARAQGFDLVVGGDVIYATQALDLTPAVLERLKSTGSSGAAPGATATPRARKSPSGSK